MLESGASFDRRGGDQTGISRPVQDRSPVPAAIELGSATAEAAQSVRQRSTEFEGRPVIGRWPLVGRDAELSRLTRLLETGHLRGAVLLGKTGVGKTRLASEFINVLKDRDFITLTLTATSASQEIPFGLLAPVLSEEVISCASPNSVDQLRRCLSAVTAAAGERRLAVLVDNAHLLDAQSAVVLQMLTQWHGCFLLATVDSRQLSRAPTPLLAFWRDDGTEFIDVEPLSDPHIAELVATILGSSADKFSAQTLNRLTRGDLILLRELLHGAIDAGIVQRGSDLWKVLDTPHLSCKLIKFVEDQLNHLSDSQRRAMEVVALGEPLGRSILESLCSDKTIDSLQRKEMLTYRVGQDYPRYEVTHPLHAEVLRHEMAPLRRRQITTAIAQAARATRAWPPEGLLRTGGTWLIDSDDPELLLAVASAAAGRGEFALAERLAKAAAQPRSNSANGQADIAAFMAKLAVHRGQPQRVWAELAKASGPAGDELRIELANLALDNCFARPETVDHTITLAVAIENAVPHGEQRDALSQRRRIVAAAASGPSEFARHAGEFLAGSSARQEAWIAVPLARASACLGHFNAARDAAESGYKAHCAMPDAFDWQPWIHQLTQVETLAMAGFIDRAHDSGLRNYHLCRADSAAEGQAWFLHQVCRLTIERGYPRTALQYAQAAAELCEKVDRSELTGHVAADLAMIQSFCGLTVEAAELLPLPDDVSEAYWGADLSYVRAWTLASTGDIPAAHDLLARAAQRCATIDNRVGEAVLLHSIARLGQPASVRARLHALAVSTASETIAHRAAHVDAVINADEKALRELAKIFERAGASLLSLEILVDAVTSYRNKGRTSEAHATISQAQTLWHRIENPHVPATRALEDFQVLTRAERQVATLAAQAMTNKQIAEQLHLSPRTVENQLHQVYRKLAVKNRKELPMLLRSKDNQRTRQRGKNQVERPRQHDTGLCGPDVAGGQGPTRCPRPESARD